MLGMWKVPQPACMIGMQVSQQHPADCVRIKTHCPHLGADFLVWLYPFAYCSAEIWVPPRKVASLIYASGLAGIDNDEPFRMLDHKCENRQRFSPARIKQQI